VRLLPLFGVVDAPRTMARRIVTRHALEIHVFPLEAQELAAAHARREQEEQRG
jgi:hypothetical protein